MLLSNTDALLVAVPMIGLLFIGFFRLDELFGKPKKQAQQRRTVAGLDEGGHQVCLDPDGTVQSGNRRGESPLSITGKSAHRKNG